MAYNGPNFVNDGPPAINAANLNGMVEELEALDIAAMFFKSTEVVANTDLNTIVENGIYPIGTAIRPTLVNLPSEVTAGTCCLFVFKKSHSSSVCTQILINDSANSRAIYERLLNNSTQQVVSIYDWARVGNDILQATGNSETKVMSQKAVTDAITASIYGYKRQLEQNEDLNYVTETGVYGISSSVRNTLVNKPASFTSSTATLFVYKGASGSGAKISFQLLVTDYTYIYKRLINNQNHTVVGINWDILGGTILQTTGSNEICPMSQKAVTDAINGIVVGSNTSQWANKTIVCFGDSRTWYDGHAYNDKTKAAWTGRTCVGYQQRIRDLLSATVLSEGVSGNTSKQICDRIRAYDFTNIDAVLLEGGVNDFVKSSEVTIGQLQPIGSTFDTTTVYGAWQSAVEYIMTNYPSVVIYMDIPAIAWIGSNDDVFPYNTAKIKGEVAELYNIPCKDLYKEAGINIVNRDYWYCDDVSLTNNWHLHFNDYGNYLIGSKLAEFMNSN